MKTLLVTVVLTSLSLSSAAYASCCPRFYCGNWHHETDGTMTPLAPVPAAQVTFARVGHGWALRG